MCGPNQFLYTYTLYTLTILLYVLPSSFFRLGTLLVASSIQVPSAEYFSSKGLPTKTRSTSDERSASFANSPDVPHSHK